MPTSGPGPSATWLITTPTAAPGGVAAIQLNGDIDAALATLHIKPLPPSGVALRSLCGIDTGVVARWSPTMAQLMPHAGRAVIRRLAEQLRAVGLRELVAPDPRDLYPEAADEVEARMLAALARAASPLAIDLLLRQPARWRAVAAQPRAAAPDDLDRTRILNRLIDSPLVVMLGGPNIGKSTLTNALAGSAVSIVADEPGTTRDHVGVVIDMTGLVVRFVDTPGLRASADAIESEAASIALELAGAADLILRCGDVSAPPPDRPIRPRDHLIIQTRADLGPVTWPHDAAVAARTGSGVPDLVRLIRDRLVPPNVMNDPRPWKFWPD